MPTPTSLKLAFPPMPQTIQQAVELLRQPAEEISIREVVKLVEFDPAIAAFLLKVVNSPMYGQQRRISSIQRAVMILGIDASLRHILNHALAQAAHSIPPGIKNQYLKIVQHSVATALMARYIFHHNMTDTHNLWVRETAAELFTAALLHDFGKILLLYNFPEKAIALYENACDQGVNIIELEEEVLGMTHLQTAYDVFERFKLPKHLEQAILLHHAPILEEMENVLEALPGYYEQTKEYLSLLH